MIQLTINDKKVRAAEGETILEVCRANRILVPTLCEHEAVESVGACRLCTVEVGHPDWSGWTGLFTSCLYQAADGLVVQTHSPAVEEIRREIIDLLLAQAPAAEPIRALARSIGINESSYPARDEENSCIMCSLCVRVCAKTGTYAIATQGRGASKYVGTPFDQPPDACIGCLSCAHICPTDHIRFEQTGKERRIWGRTFEMLACSICGNKVITTAQRDHMVDRNGLKADYFDKCDVCKRSEVAGKFATVGA